MLDWNEKLLAAAYHDNIKGVQEALDNGADVNAQGTFGDTALIFAKSYNICKLLVAKGADVNAKNGLLDTPLMNAVKNHNRDTCKLLIKRGADVNENDIYGYTALIWAVRTRNDEICKLLFAKGADVSVKNEFGKTALMYAEENGCKGICKLLKKKKKKKNTAQANNEGGLVMRTRGNCGGRTCAECRFFEQDAELSNFGRCKCCLPLWAEDCDNQQEHSALVFANDCAIGCSCYSTETYEDEINRLNAKIDEWKDASGLECGGDPDGVTPEACREYWENFVRVNTSPILYWTRVTMGGGDSGWNQLVCHPDHQLQPTLRVTRGHSLDAEVSITCRGDNDDEVIIANVIVPFREDIAACSVCAGDGCVTLYGDKKEECPWCLGVESTAMDEAKEVACALYWSWLRSPNGGGAGRNGTS